MKEKKINIIIGGFVVIWVLVSVVGIFFLWRLYQNDEGTYYSENGEFAFEKFSSLESMQDHLSNMEDSGYRYYSGMEDMVMMEESMPMTVDFADKVVGTNDTSRSSDTYVQVVGIDEADMVKTDGEYIYIATAPEYRIYNEPMIFDDVEGVVFEETIEIKRDDLYPDYEPNISIINTLPAETLSILNEIEDYGDLLMVDDYLLVLGQDSVVAYDIADVKDISSKWELNLEEDTYIVDVRLIGDQLYLVTSTYIYDNYSCEIPLYRNIGRTQNIICTDVYYPYATEVASQIFTVSKIDATAGEVDETISFMGTSSNTVIYMSYENIYVSYSKQESMLNVFQNMYLDEEFDLFPNAVIEDIRRVYEYDISDNSKYTEIELIINEYERSLSDEEREILGEKMDAFSEDYFEEHKREFLSTGIVKISSDNLVLEATSEVPGNLLNSFSMDEYDGNLRIATTTDVYWGGESFNDLYILDGDLDKVGEILDYGQDERIYAVRFMGETAYVVTYREIDPLYIMDLSDSNNPVITGELKIPGYSSFLHQLSDGMLLGIGKEDNEIKLSLFDTTDATDPQELDVIYLDEYWSDLINDHHAFLVDEKHEVFVVPAGDKAVIVSYANPKKLEIVLEVTGIQAVRSLYIDDYIYIIANSEIKVVDEDTWEIVERFNF